MIPNVYLNEIAKALNSESFVVPSYLTVGTTILNTSVSDTILQGEYGSRVIMNKSRTNNSILHNGLITGATITNPTGIKIYSSALLSSSSGGTLCSEIPISSGITQTTTFDIEIDWTIMVNRKQ